MITVLATGTFDLIHLGHLEYLSQARALGDRLVVIVAHDQTVSRRKSTPVFNAEERRRLIAGLKAVDEAKIGDPLDHLKIVKAIKPAIIALGHDQHIDETKLAQQLAHSGLNPRIVRLTQMTGPHYSSRLILQRLRQTSGSIPNQG